MAQNKDILVSAIVSTYNSAQLIEGKIRDLLNQTLADQIEIIVIDSNSPENEGEIIAKNFQGHENIRYVRTKERETVYKAWNRGIEMAQGKYVTNSNTDDRLRPDAFEIMARELDQNQDVALVYGDFFITNRFNQTFNNHIRCGYSLKPDYSPEIMLTGCHMGPQPMWRRSVHAEVALFDDALSSAGDYDFWCRLALRYPFKHISRFLGLYLHNPTGIVNSNLSTCARETQLVQARYRGKFPESGRNFANSYYCRESVQDYVNIGMVTFNRLEFTRQAIGSILLNTDYPYILTVIDNASNDGTPEYLKALKCEGIIQNLVLLKDNIGVAKASNVAWQLEPRAEYYLKFDNDIVIQKRGWLTEMVRVAQKVPQAGVVGYNFEPVSYPSQTLNGVSCRVKNGNIGGACVLIPERTKQRLGYWSEEYGLYGEEDADYGARVIFSGLLNCYMDDENIGVHLPGGRAAAIDDHSLKSSNSEEWAKEAGYRSWKDRRRRCNRPHFFRNLDAYRLKNKSLCVQSKILEQMIQNGMAASLDYRSKDHVKNQGYHGVIEVLVYYPHEDHWACTQIRIHSPFQKIRDRVRYSPGVSFPKKDIQLADLSGLEDADCILMNRFFPRRETVPLIDAFFTSKKPIIYETDDLLIDVPKGNSNWSLAKSIAPFIKDVMRRADALIVTTDELKRTLQAYNDHIYIFSNYLEESLWQSAAKSLPRHPERKVIIGYAGTVTHGEDLLLVEDALIALQEKYKGRLAFKFWGCMTEKLSQIPAFVYNNFQFSYAQYAQELPKFGVDLVIAPLANNPFNRCKSNIKWLEYSICGFPGVYSNLPPYASSIRDGETGFLVENDTQSWFQILDNLIQNPQIRLKVGGQARAEVLSKHMLSRNAHRLADIIEEVVARGPKQRTA